MDGPKRKLQKEKTREALKAAALRQFARRGVDGASISAIAQEAGVATGTFYVHFQDKDALLAEWLADFNDAFVQRLAAIVPSRAEPSAPLDWRAFLEAAAREFLDHWEQNRDFVEIYAQKMTATIKLKDLRDGINPQTSAFLSQLTDTLTQGLTLSPARKTLLIQGILALWLRIGLQYLFEGSIPRSDAQDMLVRMTQGAVFSALFDPT